MKSLNLEEFIVELIDNPLQTLNSKEKNTLAKECVPVARQGFKNDNITENDIIIHALEVSTGLYIRNSKNKLVGFGGAVTENVLGKNVVHLKGTAILPEYQSKGLYHVVTPLRVMREANKIKGPIYVGSRTQNPRVFEMLSQKLGFYPRINKRTPKQLQIITEEYAKLVQYKHSDFKPKDGIVFDQKILVVRKAYAQLTEDGEEKGFCMYGNNVPKARDEEINKFIRNNLNFQNGDAIILLGKFNEQIYRHALSSLTEKLSLKIIHKK